MWVRLVSATAAVLLLAGCSDDSSPNAEGSDESPTQSATVADPSLAEDAPWVIRFEVGSGEVTAGASYLRVTPSTGESTVTTIPQGPEDYEPNPFLLIDAGREHVIAANASSLEEEDKGTVTLHSLTGRADQTVDLRAATGYAGLKPIGFAFDPEVAGLLRVLDKTGRLFEYDVASGTATEADPVVRKPGYAIAPLFDSATGMPLLRNNKTYLPEGGGDYSAGDIQIAKSENGVCETATALTETIVDSSGTTWSACLEGKEVRIARHAEGSTDWTLVGTSTPVVPSNTLSMTWLLPPL